MTMLNTQDIVVKINGYLKRSTLNVIQIGRELYAVKSRIDDFDNSKDKDTARLEYNGMFDDLPFGQKVGDKFIAISQDKMICKNAVNCPASYNTLYDLRGLDAGEWKSLLRRGLSPVSTGGDVNKMVYEMQEYQNRKENAESSEKKETSTSTEKVSSEAPTVSETTNTETTNTKDASKDAPAVTGGVEETTDSSASTDSDQSVEETTTNVVTLDQPERMVNFLTVEIPESRISSRKVLIELTAMRTEMQKMINKSKHFSAFNVTQDVMECETKKAA